MPGENKKSMDPAVLAAIITVAGGIIVTLISMFGNRLTTPPAPTPYPTWTNVPTATLVDTLVPTDTAAAGEPTSTPAPDTPTPAPTDTPLPPALGEDWANDCISALWQAVPSSNQTEPVNGCLKPPVGDFSASNGRLSFLANRRFGGAEVNGLFAPLPSQAGEVDIKVDLDVLDKGEIWVGVFAENSLTSAGAVLYIPPGDIQKRSFVLLTLPRNTKNQTKAFDQSNAVYDMKFIYNASSVTVSALSGAAPFNAIPVASGQKWLFVGYRSANGLNNIGASFFDLAFK